MRNRWPWNGHALAWMAVGLTLCAPAWGTTVGFTVDPAQSTLTLSGSWNGANLWQRPVGSLNTSYSGSIQADVSDTSIQLLSANLDAAESGRYRPRFNGRAGRQLGDYGGFFRIGTQGVRGNLNTAFRDIELDLASLPMALNGGGFDAALATVTAASGAMDYSGAGLLRPLIGQGRASISGDVANATTTGGLLAAAGDVETLTLPINATFTVNVNSLLPAEYHVFDLTLTGTIVATRVFGDGGDPGGGGGGSDDGGHPKPDLPEPATLSFLALGLGLIWTRRQRAM